MAFMTATKATVRNGRSGSKGVFNANHNTLAETRLQESHIDHERTHDNIYIKVFENGQAQIVKGGFDAKQHELEMYEKFYSEGLKARNEKSIAQRHPERCKAIEDMYKSDRTAPMETILQICNSSQNIDSKYLWKAATSLIDNMQKSYGNNIKILDVALHLDEKSPHIHMRYTFASIEKDGYLMPNQTQALKQMGFTSPDKDKPRTRYNNPLVSFTDELRERFYALCERQGLTIDREVKSPSKRHKETLEYQTEALAKENEKLKEEVEKLKSEKTELKQRNQELKYRNLELKVLNSKQLEHQIPQLESQIMSQFLSIGRCFDRYGQSMPVMELYSIFREEKLKDIETHQPQQKWLCEALRGRQTADILDQVENSGYDYLER